MLWHVCRHAGSKSSLSTYIHASEWTSRTPRWQRARPCWSCSQSRRRPPTSGSRWCAAPGPPAPGRCGPPPSAAFAPEWSDGMAWQREERRGESSVQARMYLYVCMREREGESDVTIAQLLVYSLFSKLLQTCRYVHVITCSSAWLSRFLFSSSSFSSSSPESWIFLYMLFKKYIHTSIQHVKHISTTCSTQV